jgi:alkylation response protein AidB-like acyl-CoA dehydrogenase
MNTSTFSTASSAAPVASRLVERLTEAERERAARVDGILPMLREAAAQADARGEFHGPHVDTFRKAGLLGLIIPASHGGLGGSLRDLTAATFALGTACPSTALSFFFHCSSASRGLLALEAIDAGLFSSQEAEVVGAFAHKLLRKMGNEGRWLANFASESVKTAGSAVTIATEATPVEGGFRLNGVKSFGCSTGVADEYLVTAKLAGSTTAEGLGVFFVGREAAGVSERQRWDALGMRATATHGIVLKNVFVKTEDALAIPGAFVKMMQMSRGSFVGNQLAATAAYLGAAQTVYDYTLRHVTQTKFEDTGRPIGESPMHQELLGHMAVDLETAYLWLRRQLELETSEPPLLDKAAVVRQWRMCKGEVAEAAFRVGMACLKAGGTGQTGNHGTIGRSLRDLAMGLVQAFPAERGRLEVAKMAMAESAQALFGLGSSTTSAP